MPGPCGLHTHSSNRHILQLITHFILKVTWPDFIPQDPVTGQKQRICWKNYMQPTQPWKRKGNSQRGHPNAQQMGKVLEMWFFNNKRPINQVLVTSTSSDGKPKSNEVHTERDRKRDWERNEKIATERDKEQREGDRQRQRERQRGKQREAKRERQTERKERQRNRERQKERRETKKQRERDRGRQTETKRQTDKETDKQRDKRETDRQTETNREKRETEKQRETERG